MNPDAKKYAYAALLAGSVGFGILATNRLTPMIGWFMATLAGVCVAEAIFVVIDHMIDLITKRLAPGKQVVQTIRPKMD